MSKIANNLTELIGNTPLVNVSGYCAAENIPAKVVAKVEFFNPLGSVKDRAALYMIEEGEKDGRIKKDTVIIEPTSGNTGVGLAYIGAIKGYKTILTMPESMSIERRKLLEILGAEIVLTSAAEGMSGAIKKAEELAASYESAFIPNQFENDDNAKAHRETTAQEILRDTDGGVDIFVAGVGSGGTITGVGEVLKAYKKEVQIIAVEPEKSPVISTGKKGAHGIQGIGAGFVPKVLNREVIDEVITVKDEDAIRTAQTAAKTDGLLIGISSGAALWAAGEMGKRPENAGKTIVVLLPDTGERYLSTALFQ